jgi:hypothetical protein
MNRSVFWALVRKDLYLLRGFIVAMLVFGVGSWLLMGQGGRAFAVGGLLFLTANVAGCIFIALYALLTERKEQARLFALSLPVSGKAYNLAKIVAAFAAFGIPWALLTAVGLMGILFGGGGQPGMLVYGVLIQGFILAMFTVVLASLFAITTEAASGVVILGVNIGFSLFMMQINQPQILTPWKGPQIAWTPFARNMLAGEILVTVLALALIFLLNSRRRDHV